MLGGFEVLDIVFYQTLECVPSLGYPLTMSQNSLIDGFLVYPLYCGLLQAGDYIGLIRSQPIGRAWHQTGTRKRYCKQQLKNIWTSWTLILFLQFHYQSFVSFLLEFYAGKVEPVPAGLDSA